MDKAKLLELKQHIDAALDLAADKAIFAPGATGLVLHGLRQAAEYTSAIEIASDDDDTTTE